MLDEHGFVKTDSDLRVIGCDNIFCVGDIAATDPNRSSARNGGYALVAHNIAALLDGRPGEMKKYRASTYRWGSILALKVISTSQTTRAFWVEPIINPGLFVCL